MPLNYAERITFNPADATHRAAFRAFTQRWAWDDSPLKFKYDPDYSNLIEQIQEQLIKWYLNNDHTIFNKKQECVTISE